MKITVVRIKSDDDATLSLVSVDGYFQCFGLEDEYREEKIAGETRIPAGLYNVGVRDEGGFHNRYMRKFSKFHRGMLEVQDVPNFKYILILIKRPIVILRDTVGAARSIRPGSIIDVFF